MKRWTGTVCHHQGCNEVHFRQMPGKRTSLGLRFDPLADSTIARWQSQGLQLSDDSTKAGSSEVHMLIGADYCNEFLLRKEQINGETAWHTEIGWVLSGPANSETKSATVSVTLY